MFHERIVNFAQCEELTMQVAVNRVMQTYGMLVDLSLKEERDARDSVSAFLAQSKATDEQALVVEGLRFLRARSHAHR